MNICFVGDQHGDINNLKKLISHVEQNYKVDLYIQVGDFGFMGENLHQFLNKVNRLFNKINKDCWFIDGNHENHKWLRQQENSKIAENIKYIKRGTIEKIGSKTFCFIGGAYSVDRKYRKLNKSYWEEEVLLENEFQEILTNLKDLKADYFVSHDIPSQFNFFDNPKIFHSISDYFKSKDHQYKLQKIFESVESKNIIHGHYHQFQDFTTYDGFRITSLGCNLNDIEEQFVVVTC